MKFKINIFSIMAFVAVTLSFNACREDVTDLQLDSSYDRLVVEGYLTTDTTSHLVKLFKSGNALNTNPGGPISNASVTISDGISNFILTESAQKKGYYYTQPDVFGVPGKSYTLQIKNVDIDKDGDYEEYSAISKINPINPIDSFHIVYDNTDEHTKGWVINMFSKEIGGGRNFYLIKLLKNNVMLTDSVFKYSVTDNTGFEGAYYAGFPVYLVNDKYERDKIRLNDTITIEMSRITEDYFTFIFEFITDYYPKVPIFSGPSADISTNIYPHDKAVGIFAAYSTTRKKMIYKF